MAFDKTITLNSQHGTVEATATSASGKSAVITFGYVWDEIEKKPTSYSNGQITIDETLVAEFSYQSGTMAVQTKDYANIADYAKMAADAIAELENDLK